MIMTIHRLNIYRVILQCPRNKAEWKAVTDGFQERWNLPCCLGALDGKHITIRPPVGSGSTFFNYKHTFSVVLMALVDSDYRFLWMDVGCNGRISDGGVFAGSTLQQALQQRASMFPDPAPCPGDERPISYYICADDAFPLQENLIKPFSYKEMQYERRIFNYRISRGRRVVENAFGILANRFRVFLTKIALEPNKVVKIVLASCALHNMLRDKIGISSGLLDHEHPETHKVTPGSWREDEVLQQASLPVGTNVTSRAKAQREYLVKYFNSEVGSVAWQDAMI